VTAAIRRLFAAARRGIPARAACIITALAGLVYAAAGVFSPTATNFVIGVIVVCLGVIGYGAVEAVDQ
jgi:hypothetical protein